MKLVCMVKHALGCQQHADFGTQHLWWAN